MIKPKKCTIGPKHKWAWRKNTTTKTQTLSSIHYSLRGIYRCECGEYKCGEPSSNGPDLRGADALPGIRVAGITTTAPEA